MATIRVRDWTKEQIEQIREEESHSSHDSVIKTLLKDRELAQFADQPVSSEDDATEPEQVEPPEKKFDDLTVLAENVSADNGVLFLWCPNCGNEIAHIGLETTGTLDVFEVECQRCLTRLDQHAVICIEIGYPLEQRLVNENLEEELKECVVDYWDRTVENIANGSVHQEIEDEEHFLWQVSQYYREFNWDWPTDSPVVGLDPAQTYRNEATGEHIEFIESVSENRNSLNDYRVRRYESADGEGTTEVLEAADLMNLLLSRSLYLADE